MKVLIVSSQYAPAWDWGGPVKSIRNIAIGLAGKGIKVVVVTTNAKQSGIVKVKRIREDIGVQIVTLPIVADGGVRIFNRIGLSKGLVSHLIEAIEWCNIAHIEGVWGVDSILAARMCCIRNRPYVLSARGNLENESLFNKRIRKKMHMCYFGNWMINNSAGILYTTEIEKDRSPEWIRRHKYTVIPNIIDANSNGNGNRFRKKYKIKEEDIVLGIIGRIHRQKGFELLINALSAVFHLEQRGSIKRIIVAVIGKDEDDYKKVVQRISYQGGIDNRVLFTGVLSGEALDDAFQGIDALVMPSVRESFGNVALEAIANAKPVIIADTIGIAPWVKRNNMGIVLERDMAKWVEVLNDIDNRIHSIDTARGKELVERDYSNNSVMTKFILMYKNIIEEHGK